MHSAARLCWWKTKVQREKTCAQPTAVTMAEAVELYFY